MKIESFVANVRTVGPPDRAEYAIFGVIFCGAFFLPIQAVFVKKVPLYDVGTAP